MTCLRCNIVRDCLCIRSCCAFTMKHHSVGVTVWLLQNTTLWKCMKNHQSVKFVVLIKIKMYHSFIKHPFCKHSKVKNGFSPCIISCHTYGKNKFLKRFDIQEQKILILTLNLNLNILKLMLQLNALYVGRYYNLSLYKAKSPVLIHFHTQIGFLFLFLI